MCTKFMFYCVLFAGASSARDQVPAVAGALVPSHAGAPQVARGPASGAEQDWTAPGAHQLSSYSL